MPGFSHRTWLRYAFAVAVVAAAAGLRALIYDAVGGALPFLTFFPAVLVVALFAGTGPGLLAIALSAFATTFWFEPVWRPLVSRPVDQIGLALFVAFNLMAVAVTERARRDRRRAEAATVEQARLAAIVETSDDAIIAKSLDGTIQSWNAAAQRLFGYAADEIVGRSVMLLVPPDGEADERRVLAAVARGELVDHYETLRRRKDGTVCEVSVTISPLRDTRGNVTGASTIVRSIAERRRAEREVLAAKAEAERSLTQLRAVVASMSEGLVVADASGKMLQWNDAALRIHGFSSFAEVEKRLADFTRTFELRRPDGSRLELADWPMSRALRGETFADFELQVTRHDIGLDQVINYSGTAVRDADGHVMLGLITLHDVTRERAAGREREQLLTAERAARAEAERNSRLKDEFLATLSHELRTPLNAILGWAQILRGAGSGTGAGRLCDEGEVEQALDSIERNARAQARIVEDLLDMSRIIGGKIRIDVQRVDLASVIERSVETVRPAADARGVRLHVVLDPLAGPVSGDPHRLQQVFWNLLSNAVKFSKRGGRVQVLLERVNSHLEVTVVDRGEGIRPEFLPHVFDRFRQADASSTRRHGGLGLGLSIAKQLVEAHGGTIRAKSAGEGHGATFVVTLPLSPLGADVTEPVDRRHPRAAAEPLGRDDDGDGCPTLEGIKVLVVDDEPDARAIVKRLLENCRATVVTAGSATEALEAMSGDRPHVLVSDIGMPEQDGYELIRRVRSLGVESGGRVPAVALTAYARPEDRRKVLLAGYQMHVAKPVEPPELIAVVASLVGRTDGGGREYAGS